MRGSPSPLTQEGVLNIGHQTNVKISKVHEQPVINIHEGFLGFPTLWKYLC